MAIDAYKKYSPLVLRIALAVIFLWFGYMGITNPAMFVGLVPAWALAIAPAKTLILIHGIVELVGGLLLLANWQIRVVSAILLLNLIHTITLLPYGPVFMRDVSLAIALFAIFLQGEDRTA
jgi:uncharacterized membrane protein YphA (DoxX/SURF4 family)